ncbi:amidohydrolase family protein [Pollutimonas bauzanensis]|nr:amidohydrolase family protein [Pollutimonas bauzanensis]
MDIVDTHIHVFNSLLPLAPERRYAPSYDATMADYFRRGRAAGITRAVLVQPSFLGCDNSFMCAELQKHPGALRGIAAIPPDIAPDTLADLRRTGVVGIRLNLDGLPLPCFHQPQWRSLLAQLARHDMLVEVHRDARDLRELIPPLLDAGLRVVVDHFGRPDDALGCEDTGFRYLLSQAASRRVWVKLAAGYRNGWSDPAAAAAVEAGALLLEHFGADRLVWGSDWPHTRHEESNDIPGTLAALGAWVPSAEQRHTILGASAMQLFGFES